MEKNIIARAANRWHFWTRYQSAGIDFGDWIALFTLCLAPVIAHLMVGVPDPTILSGRPPRWIDKLCLYHPTSILWRYFIIVDRRLRCFTWTAEDMAASNTYFWVDTCWDTGEEIMIESRKYLVQKPTSPRIDIVSSSAVQTLIATLQGAQALYYVIGSYTGKRDYTGLLNLATLLQPLAILGLFRLPAALWLSPHYAYQRLDGKTHLPSTGENINSQINLKQYLRPAWSIMGFTTRMSFLIPLLALCGYTIYCLIPHNPYTVGSMAAFFHVVFFAYFLVSTCSIFVIYFIRGDTNTTLIPCHNTLWYRIHTITTFFGVMAMIIIAATETRKTWCGAWTTVPVPKFWFVDMKNATAGAQELLLWDPCPYKDEDFVTVVNYYGIARSECEVFPLTTSTTNMTWGYS